MEPGGFPSLQNWCDPTASGWVGSIPTRSRHTLACMQFHCGIALAVLAVVAASGSAQRPDTARAGVARPKDDAKPRVEAGSGSFPSGVTPPISPRQAFLYSLFVPGLGQARLERPAAGGLFALVEAVGIAMTRQTRADLRLALRYQADSVTVGYRDSSGVLLSRREPSPFYTADLVKSRRTQNEDWVAVLVFNHLFAAADAFVAAQLWDLPAQVSLAATDRALRVEGRVAW